MKLNRVSLTKDEAGWFARNVPKMKALLEASEAKNPGVKDRASYKIICKMEEQAAKAAEALKGEAETIDIYLTRKQKLMLREAASRMGSGLEIVNEEYRKRGGHEEYIEANEYKAQYLKSLARKLK
jgi:hypothetical protein